MNIVPYEITTPHIDTQGYFKTFVDNEKKDKLTLVQKHLTSMCSLAMAHFFYELSAVPSHAWVSKLKEFCAKVNFDSVFPELLEVPWLKGCCKANVGLGKRQLHRAPHPVAL